MSPAYARQFMPGHRALTSPLIANRRPPVHTTSPATPDGQSPAAVEVGAGGKVRS